MATVRIPAEQRTLTDQAEVTEYLATLGIEYERWPLSQRAAANAPAEAVLAAYAAEINKLKARGGYVTADVIDVTAATPNLETIASLPILFSHTGYSAQELARAGVDEGMVRVSIGLEDADDLIADLAQALEV